VENGRRALEEFDKRFFPIVITDWMMPEVNGLELCESIRGANFSGYVYILILTAKDSKDDIVDGLKSGADDYLIKPFNPDELIARLNTGVRILKLERSLKRAKEEIRILSITDALTKCYNRSYMTERLPTEIKRAKRYKHPFTLVFCDLDHFKKVNDTYGHQSGDLVLKKFVECIKGLIREDVDWIVRYGGEEFLIVLPETDVKGGCVLAERLRHAVSQTVIELQDVKIKITASFGVNGYSPDTDAGQQVSIEDFINRADQFLYQAKEQGRNRVVGPQI